MIRAKNFKQIQDTKDDSWKSNSGLIYVEDTISYGTRARRLVQTKDGITI